MENRFLPIQPWIRKKKTKPVHCTTTHPHHHQRGTTAAPALFYKLHKLVTICSTLLYTLQGCFTLCRFRFTNCSSHLTKTTSDQKMLNVFFFQTTFFGSDQNKTGIQLLLFCQNPARGGRTNLGCCLRRAGGGWSPGLLAP